MRVFVTGGSGFLGRHALPLLCDAGDEVMALARSEKAVACIRAAGAEPVTGDLDDPESLDYALSRAEPEALLNIASLGFGHAPTVVAAAEAAGLERAVFLSTTAIFTKLDAQSKTVRLAAERTVMNSSLAWTILRPTMIYGTPDDRNMARLLRFLKRWRVAALPAGGRALLQPVHVDDLAAATVAALHSDAAINRTYDLGGPEPLALTQVVTEAAAAVGRHPMMIPVPLGAAAALVRGYERLVPSPRLRAEQVERLGEDKTVDIRPARDDLAFAPRPFGVAIRAEASMLQ